MSEIIRSFKEDEKLMDVLANKIRRKETSQAPPGRSEGKQL
jgi:hypothetical protein